jgi:t-SNARE complex subunit (syntaxin)
MVDRTLTFHSLLPLTINKLNNNNNTYDPPTTIQIQQFLQVANEIRNRIESVHRVLNEVTDSYTNYTKDGMSDEERDRVDLMISESLAETEMMMAKTLGPIRDLIEDNIPVGFEAFKHGVSNWLRQSFRIAQEAANKRRVWRQQHVLESRDKLVPLLEYGTKIKSSTNDDDDSDLDTTIPATITTTTTTTTTITETILPSDEFNDVLKDLSPEEIQELEYENDRLGKQLRSELEEARAVERTALEVSQLLQTFSEKVVDQRDMIVNIRDTAVQSVGVVEKVPDELEQATERSASFRRMLLAFLFVSALLLLLMDWLDT